MSSRVEMLEGCDDSLSDTEFRVGENLMPQDGTYPLKEEDFKLIFKGDRKLASAWIGWGVIRKIVKEGGQAILLHNKRVKPHF